MYLLNEIKSKAKKRVQLMGSGTILREVEAAADILATEFDIGSDVWSATSFNELGRNAQDVSRWNMLHPEAEPKQSYVEECLSGHAGPVIAATDYVKAFAEQIREFVPANFKVLGTDGYGRSDSREKLREFFEVNRYYIVVAALKALAEDGTIKVSEVSRAIKKFNIDSDKPNPVHL
jgi:pyruvate dehydrogenase E1 component